MPQDPLTQLMTQRALMANQPQVPVPGTLSPQDQSNQDSAPLSFLNKPMDASMDFGLSAAGLRTPQAGNIPQALGAITGAAAPLLPVGILSKLGALPEDAEGLGHIGTELVKQILSKSNFTKPKTLWHAGLDSIGGRVPQPLTFDTMLKRATTRIPEASNLEIPNIYMSRPKGMPAQYARDAKFEASVKPSPEAKFETARANGKYDRPSIQSLDELQNIRPSPTKSAPTVAPEVTRKPTNGGLSPIAQRQLAKYGFNENDIREIRSMGFPAAQQKYPNITKSTLYGISRGDTFGWVK